MTFILYFLLNSLFYLSFTIIYIIILYLLVENLFNSLIFF